VAADTCNCNDWTTIAPTTGDATGGTTPQHGFAGETALQMLEIPASAALTITMNHAGPCSGPPDRLPAEKTGAEGANSVTQRRNSCSEN
jgi:hypothetical protein